MISSKYKTLISIEMSFVQNIDQHLALNEVCKVPYIAVIFPRNIWDVSFVTEIQKYFKDILCHV